MFKINQTEKPPRKTIINSSYKAFINFWTVFPVLLGVILLIGLFRSFISSRMITTMLTGELLKDSTIGAAIGSISTGNPLTSYISGGELLKDGVSLYAVAAFIVAWVTVGLVQLPGEISILGKAFAVTRNILNFFLAILVAFATAATVMVIQ
jgi:hypothetical protein